jgi:hypothetical protein
LHTSKVGAQFNVQSSAHLCHPATIKIPAAHSTPNSKGLKVVVGNQAGESCGMPAASRTQRRLQQSLLQHLEQSSTISNIIKLDSTNSCLHNNIRIAPFHHLMFNLAQNVRHAVADLTMEYGMT